MISRARAHAGARKEAAVRGPGLWACFELKPLARFSLSADASIPRVEI